MRRLAFILLAAHGSLALAADWVRLAISHSEDQYNEIAYWKKALFKPSPPVKTQESNSSNVPSPA